jgi:hypothetical protein
MKSFDNFDEEDENHIHWQTPDPSCDPRPDDQDEDIDAKMRRLMTRVNDTTTPPPASIVPKLLADRPAEVKMYAIKIYLTGIKPEIWRKVRVPSDITLDALHHKVIVPVLGWTPRLHG